VISSRKGERADGQGRLIVSFGRPGLPGVMRFPNSSLGGADQPTRGIARIDGNAKHSAANGTGRRDLTIDDRGRPDVDPLRTAAGQGTNRLLMRLAVLNALQGTSAGIHRHIAQGIGPLCIGPLRTQLIEIRHWGSRLRCERREQWLRCHGGKGDRASHYPAGEADSGLKAHACGILRRRADPAAGLIQVFSDLCGDNRDPSGLYRAPKQTHDPETVVGGGI